MAQPSTTNVVLHLFSSILEKTTHANYALSLSLAEGYASVGPFAVGTVIFKIILGFSVWLENEKRSTIAKIFESGTNLGCGALLAAALTRPEMINSILPTDTKPISMALVITSLTSLIIALKNTIAAYKLNSREKTDQSKIDLHKNIAFFISEGLIFSGMLSLMENIIPNGYILLGLGILTAMGTGIYFYKTWDNLWQPASSPHSAARKQANSAPEAPGIPHSARDVVSPGAYDPASSSLSAARKQANSAPEAPGTPHSTMEVVSPIDLDDPNLMSPLHDETLKKQKPALSSPSSNGLP